MKVWPIAIFVLFLVGSGLASDAFAADRGKNKAPPDYGQDLISVATEQHGAVPTGNCVVWANAEGLGVGRAQLGAYHGVSMNIDLKPLGNDGAPTPFAVGIAALRRQFPTAPEWLVKTIEKNQAAIERACVEDHDTRVTIHKITAADEHG
jgi:hypothetical protein